MVVSRTWQPMSHLASISIKLLHVEDFNKTLLQRKLSSVTISGSDAVRLFVPWQELSGTTQSCRGPNPHFFDSPTQYVADRAEEGLLLIAFAY
jgi:hypothetical protein